MKFVLLFLLCIIPFFGSAQSLQGTIHTLQNKPIPYADVVNISGDSHAHTDEKGTFLIEHVHPTDTLRVMHMGYESVLVVLSEENFPLSITMKEKVISLEDITITPDLNALHVISDINLQTKPVTSSQEILQNVPGLIIGQHAGGGKAEQIFLRGFDIDHGTDINITADGMPVNMVSHAHGQGYADLHFLIPETIEEIDFGKGPYNADKGNLATAGYINLKTKNVLDENVVRFETGQFNTFRTLGMLNLLDKFGQKAYVATEYISTDGPFDAPQNFNRINLFGKYTGVVSPTDRVGITLSHFSSQWDASGQIPQRAIDEGLISRFGAIDSTEGGQTGRTNLIIDYEKTLTGNAYITNKFYLSHYHFDLFSNFTFYLEDSINGDQIRQKEDRTIYGGKSTYHQNFTWGKTDGNWEIGAELRNDKSNNNELSHTKNRQETLINYKLGDINETNLSAFANAQFNMGKLTINPGIRVDYFNFQYYDKLQENYSNKAVQQSIVSPKLNFLYHYTPNMQYYLKMGKGFHSNDTRVVVAQNGYKTLPAAYGTDAGFIWKPTSRWLVNMAYWYLFMEQEFVYVGDAAVVEPSGRSQRQGLDLSLRHQPLSWLFANLDVTYTNARAMDEERGNDFIPLAPIFTLTGGINVLHPSGITGGINVRHIGDRPANEDNSIVAIGYTVVDMNVIYRYKSIDFGVQILNLLNTAWNETQFATESRLQNEPAPVEEIHFTPGTPFNLKGFIQFRF